MDSYLWGAAGALWLGILTSISPCPLATNIAAVSFIGRRIDSSRRVLTAGLLYTGGRMLTYVVLGAVIVAGLQSVPEISNFLQKYMNKILGPVLILIGMVLLELVKLPSRGSTLAERAQKQSESWGIWGALLLGVVFALSFCPVSAALFFGSLSSLALKHNSAIVLPSFYGLGTGLPVIVFALLLAFGTSAVNRLFKGLTRFEFWARRITGVIFIAVGIYYCLKYIFRILD